MLRRNLELKARCGDLAYARDAALRLGAAPSACERQRDTFYNAREGRLKLREIERWPGLIGTHGPGTRHAELIWYDRPNHLDVRTSAYRLVAAPDPAGLHAALTAACGVRGVVAKDRTILLWRGVRIHLDTIDGLGTFVEFEAVLGPGLDPETAADLLGTLQQTLRIDEHDRIATAYADLLGL
jgi:adenylate cyclase class 2